MLLCTKLELRFTSQKLIPQVLMNSRKWQMQADCHTCGNCPEAVAGADFLYILTLWMNMEFLKWSHQTKL